VDFVDQLPALIGVVLGAAGTYVTTNLAERSRWRRQQLTRWDETRLTAAEYGYAVAEVVAVASRIAASHGLTPGPEPLEADEGGLTRLANAEADRARRHETLRLLADKDTLIAIRKLNIAVWRLERLARGRLQGNDTDWQAAWKDYVITRDSYIDWVRSQLKVPGSISHLDHGLPRPWELTL
jgi:hypothetical protein